MARQYVLKYEHRLTQIAHVEPFHYPDLAGNWLTDKDRLGTRRQLKIYPKKADAYEMQQRAEIAAAKTNGFPNGNHK